MFDVAFSLIALFVTSPLWVMIAIGVRVSSPGPALFRQRRVGQDGKLFTMLKFRSMSFAREVDGPLVTSCNDLRITPLGAWLRRTKLDELPQFWNVLIGDMSLVGPRPEVPKYVAFYNAEQRQSLSVRPGITNAVSIRYRREEALLGGQAEPETFYIQELMPQKLAINKDYLEDISFVTDLGLLLKTAWTAIVR